VPWLALALVTATALWHLRSAAIASQARESELLSLASSDAIERGLRAAEEGLQALRDELQEGRLPLSNGQAAATLRLRAGLLPLVRTLWLLDAGGRVIAASDATPAPALSIFFPAPEGLAADAMALSTPFGGSDAQSRLVALAMRSGKTGRAEAAWILAAMPASSLLGAFGAALPAADARLLVLRSDGAPLAGVNVSPPAFDQPGQARQRVDRSSLEVRRIGDGGENLVGLHTVPRYGVTALVSRNRASVLLPWRQTAEAAAASLAMLLLVIAGAVQWVRRADRRRSAAQRALQAQLARASRLESLGTLAGGVAHDFNNLLAGVVGFGEMAQEAAVPDSAQWRQLEKVLQTAMRGKSLVERILAFSRGGAHSSTVFELEPVVEEVLTLLSANLRPGIVLKRVLEAPGVRLRGDATQVFQAVMNLCTNALQAMPEGGQLGATLSRLSAPRPRVLSHTQLAAGDYVVLEISDQGLGITPEVMEHLFVPFFTTRAAQSGTGLGLAVVFGVVAEFGGAIDVHSRAGQGARFTLYLPECKDELDGAACLPADPVGAARTMPVTRLQPPVSTMQARVATTQSSARLGQRDGHGPRDL
jgi:signal transduction histidine kinase